MRARPFLFRFYCLKGANCICLDNEFYESNTAYFYGLGETRLVSEGVRFDRISVLTVFGQTALS